jgi:glycosyltransferase involved in cell wall biosynthesis
MIDEYRQAYETVLKPRRRRRRTPAASTPAASVSAAATAEQGLRVLMLTPYPHVRGPLPAIVPALAAQLGTMGCPVEMDFWSRHADVETTWAKIVGRTADLSRIAVHLRRGRFDVLFVPTAHTWAGLARDVPLMWMSRPLCPHRVLHFHGSYADRLRAPGRWPFKALSRLLVRSCDAVLLLSEDERRAWARFEPRVRFEVVLNPFVASCAPTRASHPDEPRHTPGATPVIVFVGRLMAEKGIFDLVEAVSLILRQGGPLKLIIAGDGPAAGAVREAIAARGLNGHVEARGYLVADRLHEAYDEADMLVLPTYWAEGFPTVILEAMDAGLPVVTTPLRGAVDQLAEGVNALFVPPRHPQLLAAAIRRLAGDEELRGRMGRANRLKVAEFAPEVVTARYLEILRSVAGKESVAAGAGAVP